MTKLKNFDEIINSIIHADCMDALKQIPDNSVDAIVTDPPYGISFMGKKWDYDIPAVKVWAEVLRVLKPGGHALVACGTRTQHRMAVNLEDAGFEIRDVVLWLYGSGFPKSLNIGKIADKFIKTGNASWNGTGDSTGGALGYSKLQHKQGYRPNNYAHTHQTKSKITESKAKEFEGWGTALKPACEMFTLCRKPISEKSIAENALKWGTGGLNIDGCRVATGDDLSGGTYGGTFSGTRDESGKLCKAIGSGDKGRYPANVIHDGSAEVVEGFPDDNSRFFYCAKAGRSERNQGVLKGNNNHPTVKPVELMRYLCKLITPKDGIVLDPFCGSGSTCIGAKLECLRYIGIEREQDYVEISNARLKAYAGQLSII